MLETNEEKHECKKQGLPKFLGGTPFHLKYSSLNTALHTSLKNSFP
jgi:hypothetical protein